MLISRSHGFYYLKPCKVGGTTIECLLGQLCQGENDIYTKFKYTESADAKYRLGNLKKQYLDHQILVEHVTYKEAVSAGVDFSGLRPIISIRHPYEICMSECLWNYEGMTDYIRTGTVEISYKDDDWIRKKFDERWHDRKHWNHNFSDGPIIYNIKEKLFKKYRLFEFYGNALKQKNIFTVNFNNYKSDIKKLCDEYGIIDEIPHTKKTRSYKAKEIANILRNDQIDFIHKVFKNDFEHWNWWKADV